MGPRMERVWKMGEQQQTGIRTIEDDDYIRPGEKRDEGAQDLNGGSHRRAGGL